MKIAALIARIVVGLMMVVFGLNGFLHFLSGPMPSGMAGQFITVLIQSHYVFAVSALQVAGGALLLANRYVPLGLVLLGPILVNILIFHALLLPSGSFMGILATACWIVIFIQQRQYFSCIFVQKT